MKIDGLVGCYIKGTEDAGRDGRGANKYIPKCYAHGNPIQTG